MSKPSIPQGTRDFNAEVVRKRQYILNNIKTVFELYAFEPLETPAMENQAECCTRRDQESPRCEPGEDPRHPAISRQEALSASGLLRALRRAFQ